MVLRQLFKVLCATVLFAVLFNACKEDTPDALSTDDSKDQIDASMVSVAESLEDMTSLKMLDLAESMMELKMEAPPFEDLIEPASSVKGTSFEEMEDAIEQGVVDLSLSDLTEWGTFTYNFDTEEFDFEEGEVGTFIVNTPSSESKNENDVQIKLEVKFKDVDISYDYVETFDNGYYENGKWVENETQETTTINLMEVFTDVDFTIKQDGETLLAYDMSMQMDDNNADGVEEVEKMESSFSLDDYKIATLFDATKPSDKITHSTTFTKAGSEIAGYKLVFDGNMSEERIEEIIEEIEEMEETEEFPSSSFDESLDYNVEVEVRFGDFIIYGVADADGVYKGAREYSEKYDNDEFDDDKDKADFRTDIFNKNITLGLKKRNGAAVGVAEFFTSQYEDYDYSETYYETLIRFKFEDGTYISPEDEDAEEQIMDIFEDFIDAIEDLVEEMEGIEERFE